MAFPQRTSGAGVPTSGRETHIYVLSTVQGVFGIARSGTFRHRLFEKNLVVLKLSRDQNRKLLSHP
jgi:hypothetical protein